MIHARDDYNRIQDPENLIGENEPVFLLRAKDKLAPFVVLTWSEFARQAGVEEHMWKAAEKWAKKMQEWQESNEQKVPDMPPNK